MIKQALAGLALALAAGGCAAGPVATVVRPHAPAPVRVAWEQDTTSLFDLAPIRGPVSGEALQDVFVRGRDGWRQDAIFGQYARHLPPGPITVGDAQVMVERFLADLRQSTTFTSANGAEVRQRLILQLERLASGLAGSSDRSASLWEVLATNPETGREDWVPQPLDEHPALESDLVFFSASASPRSAFALVADRTSGGDDGPIEREFFLYVEESEAIEVRTVTSLVLAAIDRHFPIDEIARALARNDRAWSNYLGKGYAQYPWESYLNAFAVRSSWDDAPRSQWVLLHPEPAVLADLHASSTASANLALLVHAVGFIRYFGDERDWFLGLSGTTSLTDDSELGLGYGGTLHFGSTSLSGRLPHVSLSVLHQEGTNGPAVAFGVDLWRLFSSPEVHRIRALAGGR